MGKSFLKQDKSGISLRLSEELLCDLRDMAEKQNRNLSNMIETLLIKSVEDAKSNQNTG